MKIFRLVVFVFCIVSVACLSAQEVGNASYYSNRFHGRKTSSGLVYHKDSMTCAHKTYPFGTILLVRNPENNKEVTVKVTDRGPFNKRLMIDLSYCAAKELDIIQHGVTEVEVSVYNQLNVPFRPDVILTPIWNKELAVHGVPKEDIKEDKETKEPAFLHYFDINSLQESNNNK